MIVTLTVAGKPFTQNDQRRHKHWSKTRKAKAAVEAETYAAIAEQHAGYAHFRKLSAHAIWPCTITVADHCRTANLRDTEACAPSIKTILDTLTDIGFWPDDSPTYVGPITYLPPTKTGRDELVITITYETKAPS